MIKILFFQNTNINYFSVYKTLKDILSINKKYKTLLLNRIHLHISIRNHSSQSFSFESNLKRNPNHSSDQQYDTQKHKKQQTKRSEQKIQKTQERQKRRSRSREKHHHKHHDENKHSHHHRRKHSENSQEKKENKEHKHSGKHQIQKHSSQLHFYDHLYFLQDQNTKTSVQVAIWSSIIQYGLRPKKILIICQNQKKLSKLVKASNINRKFSIIDQDSREDIKLLVKSNDIILMTQQKSSITLELDQGQIQVFDMVINYGRNYSIEYYSLLPQFLGEHGIILTILDDKKQLQRHERKLKIKFKEVSGCMQKNDIQKQIFNQIQFDKEWSSKNMLEPLELIRMLPYSLEETAVRMFTLLRQKYNPVESIYLKRQGHLTYCMKTDTEFNSIKYIWNFLREQLQPDIVNHIKDMKKFHNQRGVLFNIPMSDISKWQSLVSRVSKNDKKYKGYKLYEYLNKSQLPKLQDTESQQYKQLQQRKQQALKKRYNLQLFIAGVPYDVNQVDIRKFFSQHQINLFMIRILRDSSGFSKGIAFGLAENEDHFEKAMKMNGQKFGDRQLRIKLAQHKERDPASNGGFDRDRQHKDNRQRDTRDKQRQHRDKQQRSREREHRERDK